MRITFQHRWLIVIICLFASACTTEKTIIREVPATTDADALADATSTATSSATSTTTTTSVNNTATVDADADADADTDSDTGSTSDALTTNPDAQEETTEQTTTDQSTVLPNMVDGSQDTGVLETGLETQSSEATLTPASQGDGLFFDALNSGTDVDAETVSGTGTTTQSDATTDTDTAINTTSDTATDTATDTAIDTTSDTAILTLSDSASPTIIGTPGMSVNCENTLPCRWISGDTQFAVTISNADNIGEQDRLSIQYSILTSHDTQVLIASTEPAIDDTGLRYEPSALQLGEGIGGTAQGVLAADEINARIEFDRSSATSSLSRWSIGLSDAGLIRQPSFSNIPVGSATTQHADCANTLPCAWVSPDSVATITLLGVTGAGSTNRLSANFKVETTRNAVIAVDDGATAVGTDGMPYRGRTHAIGLETGAEKLTANAIPGAQVAGTIYFFTTQSMSSALQNLSLIVYEDSPVPRWNPSFLSVPVQ